MEAVTSWGTFLSLDEHFLADLPGLFPFLSWIFVSLAWQTDPWDLLILFLYFSSGSF